MALASARSPLRLRRCSDAAVANRRRVSARSTRMSTVAEVEAAVEKLTPRELREFAAWFEERQALLNSSAIRFRMYDEEEKRAS